MTLFGQFIIDGLALGAVIGLLGLGLVVIYRSTRVLSFAQGAIASLATYVYWQLTAGWGWPAAVALPVGIAAGAATGLAAERVALRPLGRSDTLTRTVATLGVVLVLQMLMRVLWGGGETFVRPLSTARVEVAGFGIGAQQLVILSVALGAAWALASWSRRTYGGLALAAVAENRDAARLLGVHPGRAASVAWALGGALAGAAGILVTPMLVLNPWQMTLIMVTAFGAALAGGFVSLTGALAGGLAIGVAQSLATGYLTVPGLPETFGFVAVFVILIAARSRAGGGLLAQGGDTW